MLFWMDSRRAHYCGADCGCRHAFRFARHAEKVGGDGAMMLELPEGETVTVFGTGLTEAGGMRGRQGDMNGRWLKTNP